MRSRQPVPWFQANLDAATQLYAGMALLPAFLLQESLVVRAAQVVLLLLLALLAGKRIRYGYFAIVLASVTVFHVAIPSGRVLSELGSFALTSGALRTGVFKGLAIVGMVFLSVAAVRSDLRIPGRAGALVARTFWAFEFLLEGRRRVTWRRPMESVDSLLSELFYELRGSGAGEEGGKTDGASPNGRAIGVARPTIAGWVAAGLLVGANWALLLV